MSKAASDAQVPGGGDEQLKASVVPLGLVRKSSQAWLGIHGAVPAASFVYRSWLEHGGELDLVRESARLYLDGNAEGELELVREPICWRDRRPA